MGLESAQKALADAQAAVDRETAIENAIKMEVRIKKIEEARREGPYPYQVTEDGDIEYADDTYSIHRHELEASINKFYGGVHNRIIPVMMVYIDEIKDRCMVYTDPADEQMFVVHKAMIATYIHETAQVSYEKIGERINNDVRGYSYSQEYRERLKKIKAIYLHQDAIDYKLIKEYSKFIDTDLILRTEESGWYYQEFYGYDLPTL